MEYRQSGSQIVPMADHDGHASEALPPGISVSKFDYSVENHFKVMDEIAMLSGESEFEYEQTETQRLSSSVTFLSKWRDFCYQPRAIKFACESENPKENDVIAQMNLPQFSSAAVRKDMLDGNEASSPLSKDFVMYVGGLVWALDWCPRVHQSSDINVEFVTVAAHPPESLYHKIGAPLTGRGLIQIWSVLNDGMDGQDVIPWVKEKPRKYSRKNETTKLTESQTKKPRGRPRKNPINKSVDNMDGSNDYIQALAVQYPDDSDKLLHTHGISQVTSEQVAKEETDRNIKSCKAQKPLMEANGKSTGSHRNKRIKDSGVNFGSNQYLKPISVEFRDGSFKSLAVCGSSIETPATISTEDESSNQNNSRAGVSTKLPQQNPRGSDANDLESFNLWKARGIPTKNPLKESVDNLDNLWKARGIPRKNPLKESVDNLDDSNRYLESRPVEFLKDSFQTDKVFLETPEKVLGEDACRNQIAPGEGLSTRQRLNSGGTETILCNRSKPEKQKERPKKRTEKSTNNLDNSNTFLQPLAVEFPEHSSRLLTVENISLETPEIAAKEDKCINHNGLGAGVSSEHQGQNPNAIDAEILKLNEPWKPRKKPTEEAVDDSNHSDQLVQALAVQLTNDPSKSLPEDGISSETHEVIKRVYSRKRKDYDEGFSGKLEWTTSNSRLTKCQTRIKSQVNGADLPFLSRNCGASLQQDPVRPSKNIANPFLLEAVPNSCSVSADVALPRLVMGLAHNGKVAWDVKWRPSDSNAMSKYRMGYLAVLLGNGALEVWEVPRPRAIKAIFSSCQKEGTDPRFMKLEPLFKCSMLKCGDRRSIPITLEWSASAPHDLILAGCHDGVVALWKFYANGLSKDTRPLLCFNADTVPIRALAWAPVSSDPESENIIVTAGHKAVKFWDIRDPFRPLWDIPSPRITYSLDWLPDPRCVVLSSDDGEIKLISILKAACDVPVTGMPFAGTQQQGLHTYYGSSSSIWSVQVSRLTGMVAYCCSDGKVICFQLTNKAVEKDPHRNREPLYLCGSLTQEESILMVVSPLPDAPFLLKKPSNERGDTSRSRHALLSITPEKQSSGHTSTVKSNSKKNPKSKTDQALLCIDQIAHNDESKEENAKEEENEVFPSKLVAMYRVRWNMNKGSERWLCYGGAGGIVRCQEISLSRT